MELERDVIKERVRQDLFERRPLRRIARQAPSDQALGVLALVGDVARRDVGEDILELLVGDAVPEAQRRHVAGLLVNAVVRQVLREQAPAL